MYKIIAKSADGKELAVSTDSKEAAMEYMKDFTSRGWIDVKVEASGGAEPIHIGGVASHGHRILLADSRGRELVIFNYNDTSSCGFSLFKANVIVDSISCSGREELLQIAAAIVAFASGEAKP